MPTNDDTQTPLSIADTIARFRRRLIVEELAPMLSLSPKTLYKRAKAGTMLARLLGGAIRFDPYLTAKWLKDQTA